MNVIRQVCEDIGMAHKGTNRFSTWGLSGGAVLALVGAFFILGLVIESFVARDVIRFRALVMSLFLVGAAAIIWSEGRSYTPPRHLSR